MKQGNGEKKEKYGVKDLDKAKKVGVGQLFKTRNIDLANDLISSRDWFEKAVTDYGEVILKRIR